MCRDENDVYDENDNGYVDAPYGGKTYLRRNFFCLNTAAMQHNLSVQNFASDTADISSLTLPVYDRNIAIIHFYDSKCSVKIYVSCTH